MFYLLFFLYFQVQDFQAHALANPLPGDINPSPARQQLALRLAIAWRDPQHQHGLTSSSPETLELLALIPRIYVQFPELENIPVYATDGRFHRAHATVTKKQWDNILQRFHRCTSDQHSSQRQRRGLGAYQEKTTQWNLYLDPSDSPARECQRHASPLLSLGVLQLSLEETSEQGALSRRLTLHARQASDMQFVAQSLMQLPWWNKNITGLEAEAYPRQHEYYEAQISAISGSSPLQLVFTEYVTRQETGKTQTIHRRHHLTAIKDEKDQWKPERSKIDEIEVD